MPTIRDLAAAKAGGRKIVMVTAYDASAARLLAGTEVDCLLVGDSAMMVVHGQRDTLGATVELMAMHTRAVVRGAPGKLIVTDFPFLAARKGIAPALDAAAELLRAGAHAVKIEGVRGHANVIRHLIESGIPVMGHLGLQPQSVHTLGGYTVQGRDPVEAQRLHEDAAELQALGVFALVLECVPQKLARNVTAELQIPTIGIGAGAGCDGQVLVWHDLLGLNPDFKPKFVRPFADGATVLREGINRFVTAVRAGKFPTNKESFS
ncbi:3-methyl-2-oxobutanoate hydroxymethyltransferase [Opitutus terrae]|uniref:3-methyl-2-oxobutanoate hydroxymethyltransferase n=1 Tax=Opitutus terrae (strain DSM 11246 / JCM 15787 / PB90-1) TaxID=452637 RepID=B1ZVH1_OPITP|nr:3-methyl-2-oxobutanoate hydroxymethyltransferase [Opitutus terrae]ACB74068.1 3-methyl-2-oxobutanoate hydroxymethyltransferase [Opitutus terrae PB90-1]